MSRPLPLGQHLARVFKEAGLIVVIGVALFLFLAIWSYDASDPGWSHAGYQPNISNLAGAAGAWLADLLVSFTGLAAWLIPVLIIWPAIRFLLRRRVGILDGIPFFMLRFSGALIMLIGLTMLMSIHISNETLRFPFTAGGLIGHALSDISVAVLSVYGSTLLAWVLCLFGLTLFMEISWLAVIDSIGRFPSKLGSVKKVKLPAVSMPKVSMPKVSMPSVSLPKKSPKPEPSVTSSSAEDRMRREPRLDSMVARVRQEPQLSEPKLNEGLAGFDVGNTGQSDDDLFSVNDLDIPIVSNSLSNGRSVDSNLSLHQQEQRRQLKIVPLSETHQPIEDVDNLDELSESTLSIKKPMELPSMDLLDKAEVKETQGYSEEQLEQMSRLLEEKLKDFGVIAEVVEVNPGPVITRFEIQPAPGVKASKISNLSKDLARSMTVSSVRVVEVIPGKSYVGVEIPNETRQIVHLSEVLTSKSFLEARSKLTLALGNDIAGNPVVTNLAKMPHLLVAGTTGSGKSVGVNAMLLSLLFKATPEEVRLILVDPKMLELSIYEGIPHLLTPVITDMKEAAGGLRWCVGEMERRYRLMAKMGVRNIAGYNDKVLQAEAEGQPLKDPLWNPQDYGLPADEPKPNLTTLPYIVVVIDEFADMMMMVGKKVEELIARIAQKARAAGIHLILATQRPSVDVITGLIKANVPTRIAFQVSSKIDSRTILDQSGAENLLGYGDMLYLPAGTSIPNRVHGAFVSDDEVHRTVEAWKQMGPPNYLDEIMSGGVEEAGSFGGGSGGMFDDEQDELYDEAVAFVTESRKASISAVQRKLKIGYNRAARMIETMEAAGVVSSAGSNGQREVLAPPPPRD